MIQKTSFFLFLFSLLFFFSSEAQKFPKGYYDFPIKPGKQGFLSGSMGEMRPNHFHAGLDVKVGGVVGWPVFTTAEGYVSRVKVSHYGYGRAIYITHPNGHVSVYAHLNKFSNKIYNYVLKQQYKKQSYQVDITVPKDALPISKGEEIGKAGTSGSSSAPHLHFEIRDAAEAPLNIYRLGFKELVDNVPPVGRNIAIKTMNVDSRVDGEFGRFEYPLTLINKKLYKLNKTLNVQGTLGVEINIHDRANGTSNQNGVSRVELFLDEELQFAYDIDKIAFHHTRYLNAHLDFAVYNFRRRSFEKCYVDYGNKLPIYKFKDDVLKGRFMITDEKLHKVRIRLIDAYGNFSDIKMNLQGKKKATPRTTPRVRNWDYKVQRNILQVSAVESESTTPLIIYREGKEYKIPVDYTLGRQKVYLYDLNDGLPDSICVNDQLKQLSFQDVIPSGRDYDYEDENMKVHFPSGAIFDSLYFKSVKVGNQFQMHQKYKTPLFKRIKVTLKVPTDLEDKDKYRVYSINRKGITMYQGGKWLNDNEIQFSTKTFEKYILRKDDKPPTVTLVKKTSKYIKVKVRDNLSGMNTYKATLNGKFILMEYNPKTRSMTSDRLDKTKLLKGKFQMVVTDATGNKTVFNTTI